MTISQYMFGLGGVPIETVETGGISVIVDNLEIDVEVELQ